MISERRFPAFLLVSLAATLSVLRFIYLGSIPGLHGDEALYGIKTYMMMQGHHLAPSLFLEWTGGFNAYTGPLITYVRIPLFYFLGANIFSLRLPVVIFSLFSAYFIYRLLYETYNRRTGIIGVLLFLCMPWSVIYSRFADETHTTLLFFALGGLYFWLKPSFHHKILAALFLGLGVFNHIVFLFVPLSFGLYFFVSNGFRLSVEKKFIAPLLLFLVLLSLRISVVLMAGAFDSGEGINFLFHRLHQGRETDLFNKIPISVTYFADLLDGDVFYKRTTGDLSFFVVPVNSILFALSLVFICFRYRYSTIYKPADRMFFWIFVIHYILIVIFIHQLSARYFLVSLTLSSILISIFLGTAKMPGGIRIVVVFVLLFVNCFYIGYNYFYTFKKNGGSLLSYKAGDFVEDSLGFTDSVTLYNYLKKQGIVNLRTADESLAWILRFLDIKERILHIKTGTKNKIESNIYFISYKKYGHKTDDLAIGSSIKRLNTPLRNYDIMFLGQ